MFANTFAKLTSGLLNKDHNIEEIVDKCRLEIQNYVDLEVMPSPNWFLQAANHYRKINNIENEASICELYIELVQEFSETCRPLDDRLVIKIKKNINQFEKRLYKIKDKQLKQVHVN